MAPFYHQPFFLGATNTPPSPLSSSSLFDSPSLCSRHRHSPNRNLDNLLHLLSFQSSRPLPHLHDAPSDSSCPTLPFRHSIDAAAAADACCLQLPPPSHQAFLEEDVLIMDGFFLNESPVKLAHKGDAEIPGSHLSPSSLHKTGLRASWEQSSWCRYAAKCQICRAFARTGDCLYGSRCRYVHRQPSNANSADIHIEEAKFSPANLIRQCPSTFVEDLNVDEYNYCLKKRLPIFEQICPSHL